MIFKAFKTFVRGQDVESYLSASVNSAFRDLLNGLQRLSFTDNFDSFVVEDLTIPASDSAGIINQLTETPRYRMILRATGVDAWKLRDGEWTRDSLELINDSTSEVIVTVLYMK